MPKIRLPLYVGKMWNDLDRGWPAGPEGCPEGGHSFTSPTAREEVDETCHCGALLIHATPVEDGSWDLEYD